MPLVAEALFSPGRVRAAQGHSAFDSPLIFFATPEELLDHWEAAFEAQHGHDQIMVWHEHHDRLVRRVRIALDPEATGATFRFTIRGWGVVVANISLIDRTPPTRSGRPQWSSIAFNSEKGAWQYHRALHGELLGSPADWDWALVRRTVSPITYRLGRKWSAARLAGGAVLPKAARILQADGRLE